MKAVGRRDTSKRYRCQKHVHEAEQDQYDKSTIQKLTEIFDFDYNAGRTKWKKCVSDSTGSSNDCSRCNCDTQSDSFLYAPLEMLRNSVYPLSLPPPRSDDDIQPVSSNKQVKESRPSPECVSQYVNVERRLLLHDLISGDICDS